MMKMNELDKIKLFTFILTMLQTGRNVHSALVYFLEKVAKDSNTKTIIKNVIANYGNGMSLEKALLQNKVISNFQYSILELSTDKKIAFEKLLKFVNAKKEADIFYFKQWLRGFITTVGIALLIWFLNETIFYKLYISIKKQNKNLQLNPLIQYIIDNNEIILYISIFFSFLFLLLLFFYLETYRNNIPLHYKVFKYKAFVENLYLINTISNLLDTGINLNKTLNLLINSVEPKNLRNYILNIQQAVSKNNIKSFEFELRRLNVDEITTFLLISGFEIKDFKEAFKGAEISAQKVLNEVGTFYKNRIDFIIYGLSWLVIGGAMLYLEMFVTDISLGAW
ncbi:hypothetical protein N5912_02540 [Arcobacter lacus]|uniref:hypothetical protein n=1 Tax=Arcobacter lacus TaxID=1912876 RepID=UPI0021BAF17A|nr:hypothetical protein [Arcobacter lacus]MCT7910697.1 hypothetical protein [Arcobacter lacus]